MKITISLCIQFVKSTVVLCVIKNHNKNNRKKLINVFMPKNINKRLADNIFTKQLYGNGHSGEKIIDLLLQGRA